MWIPYSLNQEKLAQIEKLLEKLLCEGEETLSLRLEYAGTLVELGQKEKAKAVYMGILAEEPAHFDTLINLGSLVYSMGSKNAALTAFAEAVNKHPNNPIGHVKLADLLRESSELSEAQKHYEIALKLNPNLSAYSKTSWTLLCRC